MAESPRVRRMNERIHQIVAQMLDTRIKDPRLGFITITDVRTTGDLQHANIFYTVLGDEDERTATGAALASAKGMIRSEVGKQLGIRLTPSLEFTLDAVPETAAHLESKLKEAAAADAAVAQLRENAHFAGDADPYKTADEAPADDSGADDSED